MAAALDTGAGSCQLATEAESDLGVAGAFGWVVSLERVEVVDGAFAVVAFPPPPLPQALPRRTAERVMAAAALARR